MKRKYLTQEEIEKLLSATDRMPFPERNRCLILMAFIHGFRASELLGLRLSDIQEVIATLPLLPGAKGFMDQLRAEVQVVILSDTFEQFAAPFMRQLGMPALLCHTLIVENDRITNYQKRKAVAAFKGLNYRVIAAGDSFNDTTMLAEADVGFLFHAPENVIAQFPQFKAVDDYDDLLALIRQAIPQH